MHPMKDVDVAWFAGFLEGEGSFVKRTDNNGILISVSSTDLDVLRKVEKIFGGSIYEAKRKNKPKHWKDAWYWKTNSSKDCARILKQIMPYMGQRRRGKIQECLLIHERSIQKQEEKAVSVLKKRSKILMLNQKTQMTHREIAEEVGVDRTYVTHVVNGRYGR